MSIEAAVEWLIATGFLAFGGYEIAKGPGVLIGLGLVALARAVVAELKSKTSN